MTGWAPQLVYIKRQSELPLSNTTSWSSIDPLSTSAKAAIGISCTLIAIFIMAIGLLVYNHRKMRGKALRQYTEYRKPELDAAPVIPRELEEGHVHGELDGDFSFPIELDSVINVGDNQSRYYPELNGCVRAELEVTKLRRASQCIELDCLNKQAYCHVTGGEAKAAAILMGTLTIISN